MKTAAAILVALFAFPTAADAQLPKVPKTAKKMTVELARNATTVKLFDEIPNEAKWPKGIVPIVENCWVVTRRRGTCNYRISGPLPDNLTRRCTGRVKIRINKRTHRVSSRKHETGCTVGV